MSRKKVIFEIEEALYTRFIMALQLTEEEPNDVLEKLLKSYVSKTFLQEATSCNDEKHTPITPKADVDYGKAIRRLPKWARNPSQLNHKIIRAYLQLAEEGVVTLDRLAARCNDPIRHPDVFVPTFSSNFAQMKFDEHTSHGKVFEVDHRGIITIWSEVAPCLNEYKDLFLLHD